MNKDEVIEIPNGLSVEVRNAIKKAGIYGLNTEKVEELGVNDRISYMLCLMHSCIATAYRIYGNVDYMLQLLHGKRHEIVRACNQFEKDYSRFISFWRGKYQTSGAVIDMNSETERLYHQVMRWAQLPENWELGDSQHVSDDTDVIIRVELEDEDLKLHRSIVESKELSEPVDRWCVTKLDTNTRKQYTVYTDIDKSSAQMSAKRLSAEDPVNIYTATVLRTYTEERTDALPMKVFIGGETVGKVGKEFK